jgi:hypothetical protein
MTFGSLSSASPWVRAGDYFFHREVLFRVMGDRNSSFPTLSYNTRHQQLRQWPPTHETMVHPALLPTMSVLTASALAVKWNVPSQQMLGLLD